MSFLQKKKKKKKKENQELAERQCTIKVHYVGVRLEVLYGIIPSVQCTRWTHGQIPIPQF